MSKGKILVIDDSPIVRKMAEVALEEDGYEVFTAEDGEEGLKITEDVMPSVILVDFIMPKLSGYQFCQAVKEKEALKDIPIILITGKGEDVGRKFFEKFGVSDYFIKPFKSADLVDKVNSIINMQKSLIGEEALKFESFQPETVAFGFEEPTTVETLEEEKETAEISLQPETVAFDFEEPTPVEILEEEKETAEISLQPETVAFDFEEPTPVKTLEEEKESTENTLQPERASFSISEADIKAGQFPTTQKSFKDVEEKMAKEYNYTSDIESAVERAAKKFLQQEFQFTIQKNIEDILKKTGVIKATDIILNGDLSFFPLKDILLLAVRSTMTGKLSIFSDYINADIYLEKGKIIGASSSKESISANDSSQILGNVYDVLSSLMELKAGSFSVENTLPPEKLKDEPLNLSIRAAIIESSRRVNENVFLSYFDDNMVSEKNVNEKYIKNYNLSNSELLIYACVNGERTLKDILDLTGFDKIQAYRNFFTLLNSDIIIVN